MNLLSETSVKRLLLFSLLITFIVVVFGSYVRLSDSGLGCPDWPGCYGELIGNANQEIAKKYDSELVYDTKKAWIEVTHRYIAAILGILIFSLMLIKTIQDRRIGILHITTLFIAAQALLGMLTVTQKLQPFIVTSHLLGGMIILGLIAAARFSHTSTNLISKNKRLRLLWLLTLIALAFQIILGGLVSTNYAGLACPHFPLCHQSWMPLNIDYSGFHPNRALGFDSKGDSLTAAALETIHWIHRLGAILLTFFVITFATLLWKIKAKQESVSLILLLLIQITLGIINVIYHLPLWAAVAHNAVAALLVVNMSVIRVKSYLSSTLLQS